MDFDAPAAAPDEAAVLRSAGLRVTASRSAVLALLRQWARPATHADVVEALEGRGWDRATLYRNLTDLTEAGLLSRHDLGDHLWRFELAQGSAHNGAHPHFVCTACGDVACLPAVSLPSGPGGLPQAVVRGLVEISVRGRCDRCDDAGAVVS